MKIKNFFENKTGKFIYKLKKNESLEYIASKLNLNINEIKKYNNHVDIGEEGDCIVIKKENLSTNDFYIVKPADTYEKISKNIGINEELLRSFNNNEILFIGKKIKISTN